MTAHEFRFSDTLIEYALPYLGLRSSRLSMGVLTTGVRAVALHDELLSTSDVAARAWWYRVGWPARVAVKSVDDVATLVRAGVTNVVEVRFFGCERPEVYASAAMHFSATTFDLTDVHLSDDTCEHVAKFQRLRALHCSTVSCGQLRTLSSCLTVLERVEVDSFRPASQGVLDDISELFPALRVFPVLHSLPPCTRIAGQCSLLPLSTARLALRLLQIVPRWSCNHELYAEAVLQSYTHFLSAEQDLSPHFYSLREDFVHVIEEMATYAVTPTTVMHLSKVILHLCKALLDYSTFGTARMHDAIVAMSIHATTSDSVEWLSFAICQLSWEPQNARTFGTVAMCDALVAMAAYATTPSSVGHLARSVAQLSRIPEYQCTFGSSDMCDAIVAMTDYATSTTSVEHLCTAISALTLNHEENQRTFGTAAMCDAIVAMTVFATSPESVCSLSLAVINLSSNCTENQRTFGTVVMLDALLALSTSALAPWTASLLSRAIGLLKKNPQDS